MNAQLPVNIKHQQTAYTPKSQGQPLTNRIIYQQNFAFQGTSGISANNRSQGFLPAFLDTATGIIYPARLVDGRQAPIHLIEGLPSEVALSRNASGKCTAVKASVIAGFVRDGMFYTREQAARCI